MANHSKLTINSFIKDYAKDYFNKNSVKENLISKVEKLKTTINEERIATRQILQISRGVGTICLVTGMPNKNVYNTIYGIIHQFDASLAYELKNVTYGMSSTTYSQTFKTEVEKGHTETSEKVLQNFYNNYKGITLSDKAATKIALLYKNGKTGVISKNLPTSWDDDSRVTNTQRTIMENYLKKSSQSIDNLLSHFFFKKLSEDEQARAIKSYTDYLYEIAKFKAGGSNKNDLSVKALILNKIGTSQFIRLLSFARYAKQIGDSTQGREFIESLNLASYMNAMVLLLAGYTPVDKEKKLLNQQLGRTIYQI